MFRSVEKRKKLFLASLAVSCSLYAGASFAACFESPAKLSDDEVSSFLSDPSALLSGNPVGGLPLSNRVRSLVGSSDASLDAVIALSPNASSSQNAALGSGLASAAAACELVDPDYSEKIRQAVVDLGNDDLLTAFLNTTSDTQVAAIPDGQQGTGTGGGSIDGSEGGSGDASGGSNGFEFASSASTPNSSTGSGGLSTSTSSTSVVSPSR